MFFQSSSESLLSGLNGSRWESQNLKFHKEKLNWKPVDNTVRPNTLHLTHLDRMWGTSDKLHPSA